MAAPDLQTLPSGGKQNPHRDAGCFGRVPPGACISRKGQALDIAKEIYAEAEPDMESILEKLLGKAERELDQYDQIVELRKENRNEIEVT